MAGRGNATATDIEDDGDGSDYRKINKRHMTKRTSIQSDTTGASDGNTVGSSHMDLARINNLKAIVNKHSEVVSKFLLTSKETAGKKVPN